MDCPAVEMDQELPYEPVWQCEECPHNEECWNQWNIKNC